LFPGSIVPKPDATAYYRHAGTPAKVGKGGHAGSTVRHRDTSDRPNARLWIGCEKVGG
jgi:hypothetical protein